MTAKATIDSAGRILIPKSIRQALHLSPGDSVEVQTNEAELIVRPVRAEANLVKESGIWVYRADTSASRVDILHEINRYREDRDREVSG
jgi:AbrB family looped-hinge helix DNA binding protein